MKHCKSQNIMTTIAWEFYFSSIYILHGWDDKSFSKKCSFYLKNLVLSKETKLEAF